ncbi:hypothetical protein EDC94DRAFT_648911 [Helicostylum pulchrum]|nr:hypothetical protein EDC94DRAFT_648911 [Helicostylum pulchrum]
MCSLFGIFIVRSVTAKYLDAFGGDNNSNHRINELTKPLSKLKNKKVYKKVFEGLFSILLMVYLIIDITEYHRTLRISEVVFSKRMFHFGASFAVIQQVFADYQAFQRDNVLLRALKLFDPPYQLS